jgi:methionyl-tRNA synthetase
VDLSADKESKPKEARAKKHDPSTEKPTKGVVTYDEFAEIELKVAQIITAERVPKSDKLLKLMIDIGEQSPRQLLAGIAQHYAPETLVGKKVVVVANLKPRKMMGLESNGMVLAASGEKELFVLSIDGDLPPGSRVS